MLVPNVGPCEQLAETWKQIPVGLCFNQLGASGHQLMHVQSLPRWIHAGIKYSMREREVLGHDTEFIERNLFLGMAA